MKSWATIEELPVWNWQKIFDTGDLSFLLEDGPRKLTEEEKERLENLWIDLQNEFIDKFGFSKKFLAIEQKRMAIDRLRWHYMETGNESIKTVIEIRKRELKELLKAAKDEKKGSFEEQIVILESHFKFPIDVKKTSVVKYHTYLQALEREAQRLKSLENGRNRK